MPEVPVALEFNGLAYAVMMATPANLEDFALGFALSEALAKRPDDLTDIAIAEVEKGWIVRANLSGIGIEQLTERVRSRVAESSCGLCGIENLEAVARPLPPVAAHNALNPPSIFRALGQLRGYQPLGKATGAAHAAAYATARLAMRPLGDGTTQGWFRLPDLHAALLKGAVEALIAPRKHEFEPDPVTGRVPDHATRMGHGFCELLEHLPIEGYGEHGGLAATLLVTLDHQVLTTGLGAAALVDGTEVSPGEARRLACGAGIIPAVLGGTSSVLDLGREQRLFSRAQRIALTLRDKRCRAEGCDRPASWCEAHHLTQPWAEGGRTDLADGILLCGHHHRLAHHIDYTHERLPDGDLRYHRRT